MSLSIGSMIGHSRVISSRPRDGNLRRQRLSRSVIVGPVSIRIAQRSFEPLEGFIELIHAITMRFEDVEDLAGGRSGAGERSLRDLKADSADTALAQKALG